MSKAFTKESDDAPEAPVRRRGVAVPAEVPNYVTTAGLARLRAELETLSRAERTPEAEHRLRELAEHLASAVALEPPADRSRVGFGMRVVVEDDHGARTTYRIVGAIEAAPREGAISWQSPIASALWDAQLGDTVTLPRGDVEIVELG